MKKLLFLFFVFLSVLTNAQIALKAADASFKSENYDEAIKLYIDLLSANPEDPYLNYQVGSCYIHLTLDRSRAIPYFEKAIKQKPYSGNAEAMYNLAVAHFHAHHFDNTIYLLNDCIRNTKDKNLEENASRLIEMSLNAQALIKSPVNVKFINLGKKVNTRHAEIYPFVTQDETTLIYSSKQSGNFDTYVSRKKEFSEDWIRGKLIGNNVNTTTDDITAGLTNNGSVLFVHSTESNNSDMRFSYITNAEISATTKFSANINSKYNEQGVALNKTQDTLYFASDRPGGYGGFDLYYSVKLPNGEWGIPINMGPIINTRYDENYPGLTETGNSFYFSSKGHNSMGGYDIFYTNFLIEKGHWDTPQNLGYPINDTYDNFNISLLSNKRYGYISALRNNGIGDLDIYKIVFNEIEPENLIYRGTINVIDKNGTNLRSIKEADPYITITVNDLQKNGIYGVYAYSKNSGSYVISLAPGNYELVVEGPSYITFRKEIIVGEDMFRIKLQTLNITLQEKY